MLDIKGDIKELADHKWEVIWPGDPAVDLDASDLFMWVDSGGERGVILKDGMTPTVFVLETLGDRAVTAAELGMATLRGEYEAFRYGCRKGPPMRYMRDGGLTGLNDEILNALGTYKMDLPWTRAMKKWQEERGIIDTEDPSEDLTEVSLPRMLGAFILARTFRQP